MHKYIKAAKMKDENSFYRKYPTPEIFFAEYPEMAEGGYVGNGVLPDIMPGMYPGNQPVLMNQQAKQPMDIDVPAYANGGFYQRPGYYYNGTKMVKNTGTGTYDNGTFFQQGGYPHPLNKPWDSSQRGGYPHPLDIPFDEFKKGGIHIKPENKGKFNALKKRTGKTTEELTHSKNPLTRKRAVFAQNAKKWKHEEGGYTDNELANPYHPIYQYMAEGGYVDPWGRTNNNNQETQDEIEKGRKAQQTTTANNPDAAPLVTMDPYNAQQYQNQQVSPQNPTTDQPIDINQQSDMYSTEESQEQQGQPRYRNNGVANWGSAILGVGTGILGTASILHDRFNNQKNQQMWQREQGRSDNLQRMNNSFSHGTTDQNGNMPYNMGYSQSPAIRTMAKGGYTKGQEVELSEQEIQQLIRQGYKLQKI